jgi:hypothetical protein
VSIFVENNVIFSQIELMRFCKEQDVECCAVQLDTKLSTLCFLAIYRAPTGDFETFLNKLDSIMNYLYKPKTEFVICGDINIDYLFESYCKQCLNSLLISFNLTSIVSFPTRIQNSSNSAIDNIFIDSSRLEHISIKPVINGLSDHDAQLLVIKNITLFLTFIIIRRQVEW